MYSFVLISDNTDTGVLPLGNEYMHIKKLLKWFTDVNFSVGYACLLSEMMDKVQRKKPVSHTPLS